MCSEQDVRRHLAEGCIDDAGERGDLVESCARVRKTAALTRSHLLRTSRSAERSCPPTGAPVWTSFARALTVSASTTTMAASRRYPGMSAYWAITAGSPMPLASDDDMLGRIAPVAETGQREHELAAEAAADAAVGQADRLAVPRAHQLRVDVDRPEVVDQDGDAAVTALQEPVEQGRLAGAEKAADDGEGNSREGRCGHVALGR